MTKLITVCGATGAVGGSVARTMLNQGWRVRGITRRPDADAARNLKVLGAEVLTADFDDVDSLVKAFEVQRLPL
jgi:uncharacterized protein YbjT (DUF2867 family)